jgi:hypothetical protein
MYCLTAFKFKDIIILEFTMPLKNKTFPDDKKLNKIFKNICKDQLLMYRTRLIFVR